MRSAPGTPEHYLMGTEFPPMKGLKTILSSVGEMRSCSRGAVTPATGVTTSNAAEVNALGYSSALDADRFR